MRAEELRVTNLVNFKNLIINAVIFIGYNAVTLATPKGDLIEARLDEIFPIPLTEEWLEKFGFENIYGDYHKKWDVWNYQIEKHPSFKEGWVFFIDIDEVASPPSVKIRYVHQLQNLYFCLTGEELTIKN